MKYIVLSFDDGRKDFFENAFPILQKFNVSASLNVVYGYFANLVPAPFPICSKEQLLMMQNKGIEIANHSYSHNKNTDLKDFVVAQNKLLLDGFNIFGMVLPFNNHPTKEIKKYANSNNLYVREGPRRIRASIFSLFFYYFYLLTKKEKYLLLYFSLSQFRIGKKQKSINSICISSKKPLSFYKKLLYRIKDNHCLVLQFHSICFDQKDLEQNQFSSGAWTKQLFNDFLNFILNEKEVFEIITLSDAYNR